MIKISEPHINKEEELAVLRVLRSGNLSQGKKVSEFEEKFAAYVGTKYAVAVSSGTSALQLSLLALEIGPGDEVITTPFSFIATASMVNFTGAKPVFVDITEDSFNIDVNLIEKSITKNTKAILPVHLYGNISDMSAISRISKKYSLKVIEDACQAHGAILRKKMAGSFGNMGCFSFYSTKNMTTGEGGMITTNDKLVAEKLRFLRSHGMKKRYYHEKLGLNSRMTDIQASIGIVQLKKLNSFNNKRIVNAKKYIEGLRNVKGIIVPQILEDEKHVFHQFTIRITHEYKRSREKLVKVLENNGIESGIYYPLPIHKQKPYVNEYKANKLPVSEKIADEVLSLPVHPGVSLKEVEKIVDIIVS